MSGQLREKILSNCPDDFNDNLQSWINDVESRVNNAKDTLGTIQSINDLELVKDANDILVSLAEDLY